MKKHHTHLIARIFFFIVALALALYTGRLLMTQAIATSYTDWKNIAILGIVMLLAVYLLLIVLFPQFAPTNRRSIALLGVMCILFAEQMLVDDASQGVYLKDLVKILGALLAITGPMKLLVTAETEQAKFDKEVQIIEV